MTKVIKTEILIKSTVEEVWSILTDFEKYPNWNPFITSLKGSVAKGEKVTVKIEPPESKPVTFKPTVLTKIEKRELTWLGGVLFPGLFDGEHKFELIDNGNGTVRFIQSEKFSGIFVGLFNPEKTQQGFKAMNQRLKELAEGNHTEK